MKKGKSSLWLFFFMFCASQLHAQEKTSITSAQDVINHIERNNANLALMQENVRQAEVTLGKLKGTLYFPTIQADLSYVDDRREPLSPFQSARRKDLFWQLYLESKTPLGFTLSGGQAATRSYIGQASPANPQLPYPQTYYQPEVFLEGSLDLTRDLLGYITRRELSLAKKDLASAQRENELLKHKLTLTALSLYYQLPLLEQLKKDSQNIISDFQKLESSVRQKTSRELAERSDLLNIQALLANQRADLQSIAQTENELRHSLALMLGEVDVEIQSPQKTDDLEKKLNSCEAKLEQASFDAKLSDEFALLDLQTEKADLESEVYKRRLWPELSVRGRVTSTGSAGSYGNGFEEVQAFDNPIYELGLNFSWQPSPSSFKAGKQAVQATQSIASLQRRQREQELLSMWNQSRENSRILRERYNANALARSSSAQQVRELNEQYYRGRISLFELTQQRISYLQRTMNTVSIQQERLNNLVQSLQYFNRFECSLLEPQR